LIAPSAETYKRNDAKTHLRIYAMKSIAIASQKAGVGKTTLAGHLAVAAEAAGAGPVALIDTDPQGSLAAWWNVREAEMPLFARATIRDLALQLAQLDRRGVALVIVDTPPAITDNIRAVIAATDLVIVPTRPSPHDLRAVGATVDLIEAAGKRMLFVINGAAHRARITAEAAIALSQHGAVAPAIIHQRTDFAASMVDGRTVGELAPSSRSAEEIDELWRCVNTQLRHEASRARRASNA
jgi:chromosome partitioning protein